jgi:NAD(P)H-flavin reductase
MLPAAYRVVCRTEEVADTVTLRLEPCAEPLARPEMGQFMMAWAPGVGEVPVSLSSLDPLELTIRAAGATTRALTSVEVGGVVGLRGPFGTSWHLPAGGPVVVMAGGIGLAPLRPVVLEALDRHLPLTLLVGARSVHQLLWAAELAGWRAAGAQVLAALDTADRSWPGVVGPVTKLLELVQLDWAAATALVCGPEIMMRFSARGLLARGLRPERLQVSLERNMHCGIAHCGRCQLGELLVCRDGPVVTYDQAGPLVEVRER